MYHQACSIIVRSELRRLCLSESRAEGLVSTAFKAWCVKAEEAVAQSTDKRETTLGLARGPRETLDLRSRFDIAVATSALSICCCNLTQSQRVRLHQARTLRCSSTTNTFQGFEILRRNGYQLPHHAGVYHYRTAAWTFRRDRGP